MISRNSQLRIDYSVEENIYMLPSDMNLRIKSGTLRFYNKISYPMVRLVWGK